MTVLTKFRNDFPLGFRSPFESLFNDFDFLPEGTEFEPTHEVVRTEDSYRVLLEVPGVKKEDISLDIENKILKISGEKKSKEENVNFSSRKYSKFVKTFRLPSDVTEEVEAKLEEGVLEINLKRDERSLKKKIEIL